MITIAEVSQVTSQLVDGLYAVLEAAYEVVPWTREQLESDMSQPETRYFVAQTADEIVGFLAVQVIFDEVEILQIVLHRDMQGQGIGKQLMACADRLGERFFLEVRASNTPARKLYEACGYSEIARRKDYYHAPVEDAVIMQKETR